MTSGLSADISLAAVSQGMSSKNQTEGEIQRQVGSWWPAGTDDVTSFSTAMFHPLGGLAPSQKKSHREQQAQPRLDEMDILASDKLRTVRITDLPWYVADV